jgi:D-alanyl-D-alanine carboxypeptidase
MKITTWVNIGSILIFTLSLTAWLFLVNDYTKVNKVQSVNVMGVMIEASDKNAKKISENKPDKRRESILDQSLNFDTNDFQTMIKNEVVVPKKEEGIGNTYVRAKAAIAIDVDSGEILHSQNIDKKLPIASLTKMMTALVTIDNIKNLKSEVVTIDGEVCRTPTSVIGCPSSTYCISDTLKLGEKVRASDLLEAMLVNSANDAAVALGKHIAGSQEDFAKLMNKKAKEIGLKNTHFCNPSGLDDDNNPKKCYSTARDVAQISVYALKNEKYKDLWRIFGVKERWFNSIDGKMKHKYASTNILMDSMSNCIGAKTGFTYEAGKTLMMMANHPKNKNIKVVTVILNDPYRFDDAKSLFDWIFENYSWEGKEN